MSNDKSKNDLKTILERLSGKISGSQDFSVTGLSSVRQKALKISDKLILRTEKYTKHSWLRTVLMPFAKRHMHQLLAQEMPEDELRQILWECYDDISELKNEMDIVNELKSSKTDEELTKKVMNLPNFVELKELL